MLFHVLIEVKVKSSKSRLSHGVPSTHAAHTISSVKHTPASTCDMHLGKLRISGQMLAKADPKLRSVTPYFIEMTLLGKDNARPLTTTQ